MGALEKSPKHHPPVLANAPAKLRDPRAFPHRDWRERDTGAAPTRVIGDDERWSGRARKGRD